MGLFGGGGFFSPGHGLFGGGDGGTNYGTSTNPNPFTRGLDPETAFNIRKRAKRAYTTPAAAIQAGKQLLPDSIDYSRRAGEAYAGLFGEIAPQYIDAYRNANPDTAALLALLTQGARDLNSPGYLNPYEDRMLQQSVRSSQSARGMGYGIGDSLNEILALDRGRESRRLDRGRYGLDVTNTGRQFYSPVILSMLQQYQNPAQPTSLEDLVSIGLNDTAARRNEHAARIAGNQALWGAAIQSIGGLATAAAGACWVAEVLYGADDPRTHLARAWVLEHPENSFVQAYQRHGKAWARWLERNPWARPFIKPVWDALWKAKL